MRILGVSALAHDAAVSVIDNGEVLFAAHAERYSRTKNDRHLNQEIIDAALTFGRPDIIAWYERPLIKKTRQLLACQWGDLFNLSNIPAVYLQRFGLKGIKLEMVPHHEAHAAAGYFTSPFQDASILIVDAIGEWTTISVGEYQGASLKWSSQALYPHSLGLLYSAFTQRCELKPNEEEYILMGMAAFGEPRYRDQIFDDFIDSFDLSKGFRLRRNIHTGIGQWMPEAKREDIAASIQTVTEDILLHFVKWIAQHLNSKNLVFMGGTALNCVANEKIARFWEIHSGGRDRIWIMPNPGDAGTSLGAAAHLYGQHLHWTHPYLGTNIGRPLDIERLVKKLVQGEIVGLANGRAEFGPRALCNRSLLCDPRGKKQKDKVNRIKKRDLFRPFAPVILAENANEYFDMPVEHSPYMQFTAPCRVPDELPAICHIDGSSRVQTLYQKEHPVFYEVLSEFYRQTNCPLLLNTSLNIKGEPLVDSWEHAHHFGQVNGVEIF